MTDNLDNTNAPGGLSGAEARTLRHSFTYPWAELPEVQCALATREYSYRIDKRGLTIEWDDDDLTEEDLRAGIAAWLEEDRQMNRQARKRKNKK